MLKAKRTTPAWITLEKYGVNPFDATGRLKDYVTLFNELAAAFQKAKAAGEEIEFLQLTGGESGVTDAIQTLERWQEAKEDAAKIVQSGFNTDDLHKAERAVNMLSLQFDELHDAIADLITPAAADTANSLFEVFREGTRFIRDNKEEIRDWGATLAEISSYLPSQSAPTTLFKSLKNLFGEGNTAKAALNSALDSVHALNAAIISGKGIDKNPLSQYGVQRTNQFRDELEDLRIELDYLDDYQRKLAEINLWRKREMEGKTFLSDDERIAIEELYSAKLEKIERERAEKAEQILEESKARTAQLVQETNDILADRNLSVWEKESREIQRWEQQALDSLRKFENEIGRKNEYVEEAAAIVANAAAKETAAFEREMDKIRGKTQSLVEKIFEQEHSQRDIDIMRAQKERAEMLNEGNDQRLVNRWFNNRMGEISEQAGKSRDYSKTPQRSRPRKGAEILYGDGALLSYSSLPDKDFYSEIQAQINKSLNTPGTAGYNLQQQHAQLQQALSEPISQFSQSVQEFSALPRELSDRLVDVTRDITATHTETPTVNVNPTINVNVDLGGAYVFDNEMKAKLTDDIVTEVANAIRDAVSQGTSEMNYSYGN